MSGKTGNGSGFDLSVLENAAGMFGDDGIANSQLSEITSVDELNNTPEAVAPATTKETKDSSIKEVPTETSEIEVGDIEDITSLNEDEETTTKVTPATSTKKEVSEEKDNSKGVPAKNEQSPEELSPVVLKTFGENLNEAGVIDFSIEEFEKAEDKDEYFQTKVAEKIVTGIEEFKKEFYNELPEEINELIELHKKGIPLHKVLEQEARIDSYEKITEASLESDEATQKTVLKDLLIAQGWTEEKANAKIKRYDDLGTLKDEAIEALDTLKHIERENKQLIIEQEQEAANARKKAFEDRIKSIEDTINNKTEVFGIPLTKEQKKILTEGILKPAGKTQDGKVINAIQKAKLEDPEYDIKHAYFDLIMKRDLSKIEKKVETKTVKKLKDLVKDEEAMRSGSSARTEAQTLDLDTMAKALNFVKKKQIF